MVAPAQLIVSSFKKKPRRTSEASFEERFAKGVRRLGKDTWHPQFREPGWPDRYVSGGIWAELKVLDELAAGTKSGLRKEQGPKLRELHRGGDATFYFAKHNDTLIALPFPEFDAMGLSPFKAKLAGHCYAYSDIDMVIATLLKGH